MCIDAYERITKGSGGGNAMTRSIHERKENSPPPKHTKKSKTDGLVKQKKRGDGYASPLLACLRERAGTRA